MTDRPPDRPDNPLDTPGLTVAEAAARLGVTSDAVYKALRRKRLTGYKIDSGEWRVVLPDDQTGIDSPPDNDRTTPRPAPDRPQDVSSAVLDRLQDEVRFLRQELEARRAEVQARDQEIARQNAWIRSMAERTPELPAATSTPADEPSEPQRAGWRRWFRR